jgi:hypothetical protein
MATLTLRRSDLFPVGTSVGAYPYRTGAKVEGSKPAGAPVESQTVSAEGVLTFTGLREALKYVLWAEVSPGVHRYVLVEGPLPPNTRYTTEGQTYTPPVSLYGFAVAMPLAERIRLQRTLRGATGPTGAST